MGACIALRSIVKTPLGLFLFSYEPKEFRFPKKSPTFQTLVPASAIVSSVCWLAPPWRFAPQIRLFCEQTWWTSLLISYLPCFCSIPIPLIISLLSEASGLPNKLGPLPLLCLFRLISSALYRVSQKKCPQDFCL